MKRKIILLVVLSQLFSIDIYKEIKIQKHEIDNMMFLGSLGIDI